MHAKALLQGEESICSFRILCKQPMLGCIHPCSERGECRHQTETSVLRAGEFRHQTEMVWKDITNLKSAFCPAKTPSWNFKNSFCLLSYNANKWSRLISVLSWGFSFCQKVTLVGSFWSRGDQDHQDIKGNNMFLLLFLVLRIMIS